MAFYHQTKHKYVQECLALCILFTFLVICLCHLNASQPAAIYYLLSINICIELCVASIKSIPHVRSNLGKDTVRLLTKVLICNKKPTMPNVMHILKFRNFLMHFYGAIALLSVVILLCDTLILTNVMMNTFTMLLSYQASCR